MRISSAVAFWLPQFAAFSSATIYETRFKGVTWDNENWRIKTTELDQGHYQSRMSLANGYFGINIAAVGPFFEIDVPVAGDNINGWPLFDRRQTFATIAGFYDSQPTTNGTNFEWLNQYGGESVISGVPHWSGLHVQVNGHVLSATVPSSQISDFQSSLDVKSSLLTWKYTWTPPGAPPIGVEYSLFVHKLYVNQAAVQLKLTPTRDVAAIIIDVLDGDSAVYTTFAGKAIEKNSSTIWSSVKPTGIDDVTAYIYSTLAGDASVDLSSRSEFSDKKYIGANASSIAQAVSAKLVGGKTTVVEKYVGAASSDAFDTPQAVARKASLDGATTGFAALLKSHSQEWAQILTEDSVDDYSLTNGSLPSDPNLIEAQITSVINPFFLLQQTVGTNAITAAGNNPNLDTNSIQVGGLTSNSYAGFIFWDAEVWMQPGLVVAFPQAALQIAKYRVQKFDQAKKNIKTAYQSSKNTTGQFSDAGAVFPWTSGRFGNCTGTGPCWDYEYHLNGDIGLDFYNYLAASGDSAYFKKELFPIYDAIATLFSDLVRLNDTNNQYYLTNATDPDEYANHVDNPGFTMALMKTHLRDANKFRSWFGLPVNDKWQKQSDNMTIPTNSDANIILEYQGQNGTISVKQADVVLVDDLLDFPNPYSLSDLDYYAAKQSINGPGMTYGVFSIVANEISPSGCSSYTYDLTGSQPYVRAPWFQYSEQLLDDYTANGGTHPAYPFLTGMGGANRVAVFGYLGLRLQVDVLNLDPSLPPQIPRIDYRTIYWQGHAINATSNQTHTTITRLPWSLSTRNTTYDKTPIPVTQGYSQTIIPLPLNGTIVLENRGIGLIKTVEGNVAQCLPVSSPQEYLPGQFPLAAVDGAISTKWQPVAANVTSKITVHLSDYTFYPITGFSLDWAQYPPKSFLIQFHNLTEFTANMVVNVTSSDNVAVEKPYNAASAALILPYSSNSTNITLDRPVWSARYATLSIFGNQGDNSTSAPGATVAEFAIIAKGVGRLPVGFKEKRRAAPWREGSAMAVKV